jgi:hypothetical protein
VRLRERTMLAEEGAVERVTEGQDDDYPVDLARAPAPSSWSRGIGGTSWGTRRRERWTHEASGSSVRICRRQSLLDYPGGDLGAGAEPELAQDLGDVGLDGAFAYRHLLGDPSVGQPPPD